MITPERVKEIFIATSLYYSKEDYDFEKYNGRLKHISIKKDSSEERIYKGLANRLETEERTKRFFMLNHFIKFMETSKVSLYIGDFFNKESFHVVTRLDNFLSSPSYHITKALKNDDEIKLKDFIIIDKEKQPIPVIMGAMIAKELDYNIVALLAIGIPKLLDYWLKDSEDDYFFKPIVNMMKKYVGNIELNREQQQELYDAIQSLK